MKRKSYSVRCVFEWLVAANKTKKHLYEERITLWEAENTDKAIALAEAEARIYAKRTRCIFINFSQAYYMADHAPASGIEVYSLLRESHLKPEAYLDAFFDTGDERQR